ncbi:OmpP1/FadL family transporter [Aridibaculum aurantiacum]|uniref:OmpP1/FadL family transporter n=1 Tax=Aridibaculum aurantiacum TaxID=2810307 RepID=UPI001A97431B|nr:aromatic hydrocarbon degradation protein [Aridibaculum aurantiacum]
MKKILLALTAFTSIHAVAQLPEDVLRYSYFPVNGSARNMAIGGAMGSLGGDISALYMNPAGLGLFKTREIVLTPGFKLNNNKFNYRGSDTSTNKSTFNLGTSGLVIGFNTPGSKWTSQALSIGINTVANFNNTFSYRGTNNYSSMTEVFAEAVSSNRYSIDEAINDPRLAFGTAPALYTYLVDTFRNNNNQLEVRGLPEFLLQQGLALEQKNTVRTTGGSTELAVGYAANMDDKLYIGGSVGIPFVAHERITTYRESDISGNNNNNFNFFELRDRVKTTGVGINAKLGVIFKPQEQIRLGVALHTPTIYSMTDNQSSELTADTEGYNGLKTAGSSLFTNNNGAGQTDYLAITPWKAMVSGSYVFREVNDTRRQRAFVTADIEYVGYSNAGFREKSDYADYSDIEYYDQMKQVIRDYYRGAFNFRLGGELKFNTIMFRLGGAYYGSPYKDKELQSNIIQATGGLGYRDKGMFIDLSYAHNFLKDVHFPYRLADKANTFANQTGSRGNVVLTFGFKL